MTFCEHADVAGFCRSQADWVLDYCRNGSTSWVHLCDTHAEARTPTVGSEA